jgi:hypothetical protein
MKALPKGQSIKQFQYGLGSSRNRTNNALKEYHDSHAPKAPNRLYLRKLTEELWPLTTSFRIRVNACA